MPKVENIAKGELLIDVDKLINLEKRIEDQQQTIGAYKQQIDDLKRENLKVEKNAENKISEAEKNLAEKEEKVGKEVKIITASKDSKQNCKHCGSSNTIDATKCHWCGRRLEGNTTMSSDVSISYKNLDDVVADIRKEEAKKLKLDTHQLEQEIEDLKVSNDKLYKENGRFLKQKENLSKEHEETLTEVRTEVRTRYQKQLDTKDKKIQELNDEIEKLNERMTDEIIEENRKQEVIELKTRIDELEKELNAIEEAAASKKGLRNWIETRRNERIKKEAVQEKLEKEERVEEISNNYPNKKRSWDFLKVGKAKIWNPFSSRKKNNSYDYDELCVEKYPYWF